MLGVVQFKLFLFVYSKDAYIVKMYVNEDEDVDRQGKLNAFIRQNEMPMKNLREFTRSS